jgi:integrase
MPRLKFTQNTLSKFFEAKPKGICWDVTRGLGAYMTGQKSISYFVQYRCSNGKQRKKTLGHAAELTIQAARDLCLKYTLAARHGEDLVATNRLKDAPRLTLGQAFEAYCVSLQRKGASPATLRLNAQNWHKRLSKFGDRELASLTRSQIRAAHSEWGRSGPTVSNQTLRLCRTIINFSRKRLDAADVHENVCEAVEMFKEVGARKVIAASELAAWWRQTSLIQNPLRRCYWRGLLLLGVRRQELAQLRWEHVLSDRIKIVRPKGGTSRAFELFLTDEFRREVLEPAREAGAVMHPNSQWVFAANSATGYILNPFDVNLPGSAPHMMRRTFCSLATECGVDPYTLKFLVNHSSGGGSDITARYVIPSWEHRAAASMRVAAHIMSVVGSASGEVKLLTDQRLAAGEALAA